LYQVSGPDWIDTERYDIAANVAEGATKDQVRLMLQNSAERFKAILHHETRTFRFRTHNREVRLQAETVFVHAPAAATAKGRIPSAATGFRNCRLARLE